MRFPKSLIPPPITFIMFLLILVSNIENYSAKNGRRGWGRKRKTDFFSPTCHSASQERASLETKVDQRITIDCLHYFQEKKNINTIKSDMICTEAGRKTKVC